MADIDPNKNQDTAEKQLDLEREITREVNLHRKILADIKGIDLNIERSMKSQSESIQKNNSNLKKQYESLAASQVKFVDMANNLSEVEKATKLSNIQSHKDKIKLLEDANAFIKKGWKLQLDEFDEEKKRKNFVFGSAQKLLGLSFKEITRYKALNTEIGSLYPNMTAFKVTMIAGLLIMANIIFDIFEEFDKAAFKFREWGGVFRDTASPIRGMVEGITVEFTHLGLKINDVYSAVKEMSSSMGGFHNVTKDLVVTTSLLKSQLGVSEKNTAGMLRNLAFVSKSTMQSQKNMAFFAGSLSNAAGVPLNDVMADVASMSNEAFTMMSKIPSEIIKATVEARRLNSTINEMATASRSILNFQESVNAEMEASVLIGRSINLQRARELAYRTDIVGSTQEILRIANEIDFTKLDVFQMEAFAKASGRSVDQLSKMITAQQQLDAARISSDPAVQKQLKAYEEIKAANEATAEASGKNLEMQVMAQANQERMVAITNKWNQVLMKASAILLPVVDFLLSIMIPLMDITQGVFALIATLKAFAAASTVFNFISGYILQTSLGVGKLSNMFAKLGVGAKWVSTIFSRFASLAKFGALFGKWIPIFGQVIMALQFVYNFTKRIIDIWNDDSMSPWEKIGAGIAAIGGALKDTLVQPFIDAWNWVASSWGGNSPSKVGLSILTGIQSVGSMVYDALIQPFIAAWDWVSSFWGGNSPSQLGLSILTGILSVGTMIFRALTSPFTRGLSFILDQVEKIPVFGSMAKKANDALKSMAGIESKVEFSGENTSNVTAKTNDGENLETKSSNKTVETKESSASNSNKTLNDILLAINSLNSNLQSGKIGVYIDGQLMSATIARQTKFKGGFGANIA
jgi:hypothetical protein